MTCILKYLSILTFSCLCWGTTEGSPFSKAVLHSPDPDLRLACKNIRFSSLFAAGDVSSPAAKSEEKRMFSQANLRCLIKFTILPKDLAFLLQKCQHCSPIAPFHFHCFDDNHIFPLAVFVLGLFPSTPFVSTHYSSSGSKDLKDFLFPPSTPLSEKYYYFWTPLAQCKRPCTHKLCSKLKQFIIVFRSRLNFFSFHTFLREIVIFDHW